MYDTKKFSVKIKKVMLEMGITQAELARRTGIANTHISEYVNGKKAPRKDNFDKMIDALGLDWTYEYEIETKTKETNKGFYNGVKTLERIIEIEEEIDKLLKEKTLLLESL